MECLICDAELRCRWTDTHGVGACLCCGAPYTLYHYEDKKRIDKPPKLEIKEEWKSTIKRYWEENKSNCSPGAFNLPGSSYEVASLEDFNNFSEWMEKQEKPSCVS